MQVKIDPGKYVIAVSGGVDSMVLLDMLQNQPGIGLVVAHFDHGIRTDGDLDKELVERMAMAYGLAAEFGKGRLGPGASEEKAREARYQFLEKVMRKYRAKAIITAHHQDDLIETAFLNLLRGSGRRGLSAISDSVILRPLLGVPKEEIIKYARVNNLEWREDITNSDPKYLRNYLRKETLGSINSQKRREIVSNIEKVANTNIKLNKEIATLSHIVKQKDSIDRAKFINLPREIGDELVMHWLRTGGTRQFDRKTVQRLSMAIKTGLAGSKQPVNKKLSLEIGQKSAHFATTD